MVLSIFMDKFLCEHVFSFLLSIYIPRHGNPGSYGSSTFNILRNCQTVFQSGHAMLHAHKQ